MSETVSAPIPNSIPHSPLFFVGLHQPYDAQFFRRCLISVARLWHRKRSFKVFDWMMDSAGFSEVFGHGTYRHCVQQYAAEIRRWSKTGNLLTAVTQDFMCEPKVLRKTGHTVRIHQEMTCERYVALLRQDTGGVRVLPVIQGWEPEEYVDHVRQYGALLSHGQWVGVGSVCKRNSDTVSVLRVLRAIKVERPDLRLHAFGLKRLALESEEVRALLATSDSIAWSFAARWEGRDANDWREADRYRCMMEQICAVRSV